MTDATTTTTTTAAVRIGVLSTANIARKNIIAINAAKGVVVTTVASRSAEKAKQFAEENGLEKYHGSYQALLDDPEIDAVYIPLPTTMHLEWVEKAAAAGKHVLCEKPVASSVDELKAMIAVCNENGVMFMDGVMFMHHKRVELVQAELKDKEPTMVNTLFSFAANDEFLKNDIRLNLELEPFCALGDLGWYNIRFALMAFSWEAPTRVQALSHRDVFGNGAASDCTGTLMWDDNRISTFQASFHHAFRQHAEVRGLFGTIVLEDFVLERSPEETEFTVITKAEVAGDHRSVSEEKVTVPVRGCCQEQCMWERFARIIKAGKEASNASESVLEQWSFWQQVSINTQAVLDACMQSIKNGGALTEVVGTI